MSGKRILVVEDEQAIADTMIYKLNAEGYQVHHVDDGTRAVEWLRQHEADLVLMDILMPQMDGTEALREIRRFSSTPVVFITSRTEEVDRILGLELGADDYITKPFSPREMIARVKAVLRRAGSPTPRKGGSRWDASSDLPAEIQHAGFHIDEARHIARFNGEELKLTRGQFTILSVLVANPGIVMTRDKLLAWLDKEDTFVTERVIDTHVKHIRKEIRRIDSEANPIETVFGVGYKLRP